MKFRFSETYKLKTTKRNQISNAIYFSAGALILLYRLITSWNTMGLEIKAPLFIALLVLPFAWIYFDKKLKTKLSTEYIIDEKFLITKEYDKVVKEVSVNSIQYLQRISSGYRVVTPKGTSYILDGIENLKELIEKIRSFNSRTYIK